VHDDRELHIRLLRRCVEVSVRAREAGNHPFGALLADADGHVLLEQGNVEVTEGVCTGHAEAALAAEASRRYPRAKLGECTLYTTAEPCAMCSGAIYWAGIGRVVYGISERRLAGLTGDDERNLTLDLPCRTVFAAGRRPVEVLGPFPEVEEETVAVHAGYWS
jgi:tRNA(Arg) A34 adenosine deaminase TadA